MQFTVQELALLVNGEVEGDAALIITHPAKIEEAHKGAISFVAKPKYAEFIDDTNATALIVNKEMPVTKNDVTLIRVDDPYLAFVQILKQFDFIEKTKSGIEQPSFISKEAKLGKNVYVGAFAYISDNAVIGDNVQIYPNVFIGDNVKVGEHSKIYSGVKVYHRCEIGNHVNIHSGTVVGSDGFGFAPQQEGGYQKIPQLGNVVIEDYVEIGSNCTIDRATMGSTIIHRGVKLDNLIQVAHNVEIGENTVIAAQSGISGSTKIGKNCMIGGQVGFVGHIEIADGTKINAQSGVSKSVKQKGKALTGSPAYDYTQSLRSQTIFRHLPELEKRIEHLENTFQKKSLEKENGTISENY